MRRRYSEGPEGDAKGVLKEGVKEAERDCKDMLSENCKSDEVFSWDLVGSANTDAVCFQIK